MSTRRFRVAFSFPAEHRSFVAQAANILAERLGTSSILYDKFHEAEFSRSDLAFYLPKLYHQESDLVVLIISPNYDNKNWCGVEVSSFHDELAHGDTRRLMFCRFDHATLEGFSDVVGLFIDLDHKSPAQTAVLILERLALNEGLPRDHYSSNFSPTTEGWVLPTPNNLPRLPPFFGRQRELKLIADALAPEARTWGVLIDGQGGIGKTSLAICAANSCPPGRFDRILFVSAKENVMDDDGKLQVFATTLPGYLEILNEIARLLGTPDLAKSPENERAQIILQSLSKERNLLILDNLETLRPEHRDQVYNFLRLLPLSSKAIVTSRRRTDIDARIIRLEKLERSEALDYLEELSEKQPLLSKATDDERIRLYEETGGSPLFMRWIVGQLGRGSCKTIKNTLDFLQKAPTNNDPLEFAFGDLLDSFTNEETKVLAALSHFTSPMDVRFIAELASLSKIAAQTALEDLTDRALVVADAEQTQFVLTPLVAVFLRNKRPEIVAEAGTRLEQRAYATIVENGYQKYERFPILEAAWPAIAAALPLIIAGKNQRIHSTCSALDYFLNFTGRWDEWLSLSQQAEEKLLAARDFEGAGWRAYQSGVVHYLRHQADAVLVCANRAASHWQTSPAGARERAIAIQLRSLAYLLKEQYSAAVAACREVLDLHRTLSAESSDVAVALNALAEVERHSGNSEDAERHYREALRVGRSLGFVEGVATYTGNLASLELDRKNWGESEALAREALNLSEKVGRQELIATDCRRLAVSLLHQGRIPEALFHARRAVDIFNRLGSPHLEAARSTLSECEAAI
jgi:tetratricopeptide (TPR) repeat protein